MPINTSLPLAKIPWPVHYKASSAHHNGSVSMSIWFFQNVNIYRFLVSRWNMVEAHVSFIRKCPCGGGWSTWRRVHVETKSIFFIFWILPPCPPPTMQGMCTYITFLEELGSSANHPPTHNASFCGAFISGKSNFSKSQMTLTICP